MMRAKISYLIHHDWVPSQWCGYRPPGKPVNTAVLPAQESSPCLLPCLASWCWFHPFWPCDSYEHCACVSRSVSCVQDSKPSVCPRCSVSTCYCLSCGSMPRGPSEVSMFPIHCWMFAQMNQAVTLFSVFRLFGVNTSTNDLIADLRLHLMTACPNSSSLWRKSAPTRASLRCHSSLNSLVDCFAEVRPCLPAAIACSFLSCAATETVCSAQCRDARVNLPLASRIGRLSLSFWTVALPSRPSWSRETAVASLAASTCCASFFILLFTPIFLII